MNGFTDEELCVKAKNGDKDAVRVLIERYKGFVIKVAREHFLTDGDFDDLYQEGMIGLFTSIYGFSGKSSFKNYCLKSVKNSVYSAIRKSNADKNKPLKDYVSLSGYSDDDGATDKNDMVVSEDEPLSDFLEDEKLEELKAEIREILSDNEYTILSLYLDGLSYAELGERIGKSVKSVDNAIQRIRKKIKQRILSR